MQFQAGSRWNGGCMHMNMVDVPTSSSMDGRYRRHPLKLRAGQEVVGCWSRRQIDTDNTTAVS